jgi:hypothetical protein
LVMLPSEAETVMKDIEGILQQVSRYHQLTEDQRLALHSRTGLGRQQIAAVVKLRNCSSPCFCGSSSILDRFRWTILAE